MTELERFYHSTKWKKMRQQILKRDKYLCQDCLMYGKRSEAQVVHHIKECDEYPDLALNKDNLVSLCKKCHNKRHPEKAVRRNIMKNR